MNLEYLPIVQQVAPPLGLKVPLVMAVGDRETAWGATKDLDILGPSGTGDKTPRDPSRWGCALPPDGRGWGRGLMQVDFGGHRAWCLQKAPDGRYLWEVPEENIKQGCSILHALMTSFSQSPFQIPAAVCGYNAGPGAAMRVLGGLAGSGADLKAAIRALDQVTTGKDYVSDTLRRRDAFAGECLYT